MTEHEMQYQWKIFRHNSILFQWEIQPAGKGVDKEVRHVEDVGQGLPIIGSAAKIER